MSDLVFDLFTCQLGGGEWDDAALYGLPPCSGVIAYGFRVLWDGLLLPSGMYDRRARCPWDTLPVSFFTCAACAAVLRVSLGVEDRRVCVGAPLFEVVPVTSSSA